MKSNFKIIGGFGIAEKEIKRRNIDVKNIIDKYYQVGIREFFIGYNPSYWHEKFGFEFSPNGRFGENEQITSYDTFKQAIDYVHSLRDEQDNPCEIFLTVNAWYYSDITMPLIEKIVNEAITAGIDGLIIGNMEILEYLASIGYKGKINISTILSIYNQDAINFLAQEFEDKGLKLNRIIFPREVTLNEIKELALAFPDLEFEVFGQGDYCRYANGFCLSEHKYFSRDLCGFVIKHGLQVKKSIKYDFKTKILDESISNADKQDYIDNELKELEYIFANQNVMPSNSKNELILQYIQLLEDDFNQEKNKDEIEKICKKIYDLMKIQLNMNFQRYIFDGLVDDEDPHNNFINNFLRLYKLLSKNIKTDKEIQEKIEKIINIRKKAKQSFDKFRKEKGKFGAQTYYRFMLYNRTSIPFYQFFNGIPNIKVVKIPMRGRDVSIFKLGIQIIEEAVNKPENYIDESNLSGKYFHYDPTKLDVYKDKLEKIAK